MAFCVSGGFLGAAFAIMTFNNDVGITELFAQVYKQFTGSESKDLQHSKFHIL